jgi:putative copper export protein
MSPYYYVSVTLHVLAAMLWLGGMLFLAIVAAPVLRTVDPESRRVIYDRVGYRFRTVGWACIALLVLTGLVNLHYRGFLSRPVLTDAAFWASPFGRALAWKLVLAGVMLAVSAAHDFWLGPAAGRRAPGTPDAVRLNRAASWLARLNAAAGIALIVFAARLARGG